MEFTLRRNAQLTAVLLFTASITQIVYTALYVAEANVPRQFLWGTESLLFVLMAAVAGAALSQTERHHLAWAAIAAASVLNVVQVGVGLTMFGPFYEAAGELEAVTPAAKAVVAFSFHSYNAAKILLALALIVFALAGRAAMAQSAAASGGPKVLSGLGLLVGLIAFVSNTASMAAGRDVFGELPLAGGSGVLSAILLGVILLSVTDDD
ncbi:MAG: thiamine biosynthesis protein ThiC [Pseudomonadota bacterium]